MLTKKIFILIFFFQCLTFITTGQTIVKLDKSEISFVALDNKIQSLMKAANVQGLAITIFNK